MIFVFGSNQAGRHGAGAAWFAYNHYGAQWGIGEGRMGTSYAIPTKTWKLRPRPLEDIQRSAARFLRYATEHPELQFCVTPVGTGLAGYKHSDIAPMFEGAPDNCELPEEWNEVLGRPALLGGRLQQAGRE